MKKRIFTKRIIPLILSGTFVLSSVCTTAFGEKSSEYIAKLCFDSEKSNIVPAGITSSGSLANRTVDDGKQNKVFFINAGKVDNNVEFVLGEAPERFVISFDLKRQGAPFVLNANLVDGSGAKTVLFKGSADGSIKTADGQNIDGIRKGSYSKVLAVFDTKRGIYRIKIGNKSSDWRTLSKAPSGELTLALETIAAGAEAELFADNVLMYEGLEEKTKAPSEIYNKASVEYIEEEEDGEGKKIYCNQNFENLEDGVLGFNLVQQDGIIEIRESMGNHYLYMEQENAELNMHAQMVLGEASKNIVIELDIKVDEPGQSVALMNVGDYETHEGKYAWSNLVSFSGANAALISSRTSIGNLSIGKWQHIAAVMNMTTEKFDLYIDGVKKMSDGQIHPTLAFKTLSSFRIMCTSGGSGKICVDNIKVYDGREIRDISEDEVVLESVFANDSVAENFLKNKTAINPYTCFEYINGEKKPIKDTPVIDGEKIYISQGTIFDFLGEVEGLDEVSKITKDGKEMYLLSEVCEKSPRYVYDDDHGCFISAESEFEATSKTLKKANYRISFERPDIEQIKADLIAANGSDLTRHPRIVATADDFSKLREEVKTGRKKEWFDKIKADADEVLDMPVSIYDKYDGLRILEICNEIKRRMEVLGFCWQITGEQKYADRAIKEFEAVLAFPDWNAKDHFLDTGTLATAIAIGYDWFYDALSPEFRQKIYDNAKAYGLSQQYNSVYGSLGGDAMHIQTTTNHSPTTNGGMIELSMALAEHDPDYCSEIISYSIRALEYCWYCFAPNGVWYEGPGYWYGTIRDTGRILASMNTAINKDYNLSNYKGLKDLPLYQPKITGPTNVTYNYHDSSASNGSTCSTMFWLSKRYNDASAASLRLKKLEEGNTTLSVYDIIWCDNSWDSSMPFTADTDFYDTQTEMVIMRKAFNDENSSWLAFHGAETYGGHNHHDAGSFVYEINGVRWAVDLGVEMQTYYVDFSKRNEYYRVRGEGHNGIVINPSEDGGQDMDGYAPITRYETNDQSAISVIDLSSDYKGSTNSYQRGFMLSDDRNVLTVRDEISLKESSDMYWFMHTNSNVEIVDNNTAVLTDGEKQMKVQFLVDADDYELSVMEAEPLSTSPNPDNQSSNKSSRKLALKIRDKGKTTVTARLSMMDNPISQTEIKNLSIDSWKLETETAEKAQPQNIEADMIYLNGKEISEYIHKDFDKTKKIYDIVLYDEDGVPTVTAKAGEHKTEAQNSKFYDGTNYTIVKIYDDNGYYSSYMLKYKMIKKADMDFGKYQKHVCYDAWASSVPQPENNVANSYDGYLETRWSTPSGEFMVHDLGESKKIDALGIAFMSGSVRASMFEILVSEDGENYTSVLSATSSGKTEEIEIFELDAPVTARYVKYLGFGNTVNYWNSITEFYALEKK